MPSYEWKGKCILTKKSPINPLSAPLTPQNRLDTIRKANNGTPNIDFFAALLNYVLIEKKIWLRIVYNPRRTKKIGDYTTNNDYTTLTKSCTD